MDKYYDMSKGVKAEDSNFSLMRNSSYSICSKNELVDKI